MDEIIYKTEQKQFLGMNVTIVDKEWIVINDIFKVLNKTDNANRFNAQIVELTNILSENALKIEGGSKVTPLGDSINTDENELCKRILIKQKQGKRYVKTYVKCVKLDVVPIILIQLKPNKNANKEVIATWKRFINFIYDLLRSLEVYKFIITDKQNQLTDMDRLINSQGSPMIANQMVNKIMGELILYNQGDKFPIIKDTLRYYQNQTTVDLLTVREYVLQHFVNAYEFTHSHKTSYDMTLKLVLDKYADKIYN